MSPVTPALYRVEHVMGMPVTLHIAPPAEPRPDRIGAVADEVYAWLRHVDAVFSTYRPDSPISRLAAGAALSTVADPDGEVAYVLERCAQLWRDTDGYFDASAPGRLDPSGYVKGWAVQRGSDLLAARGCGNHQLNAGGDLVARGRPERGRGWRIGIQHPFRPDALAWVVEGADLAVATSGTYARGTHVVDPHTGRPATELCSVTVLGPLDRIDLGTADAYATAALAMGRAGARWLAGLPDLHGAVVTADGRAVTTPGFPAVPGTPGGEVVRVGGRPVDG